METFELKAPQSWEELTDEQYLEVLEKKAKHPDKDWREIAAELVMAWNKLRLLTPWSYGWILRDVGGVEIFMTSDQLSLAVVAMEWLSDIPEQPRRLEIKGADPAAPDLSENFTFSAWLSCENLWQGYLQTEDESLLRQMAAILYGTQKELTPAQILSAFYWWAAAKKVISAQFPNFFRPVSGQSAPDMVAVTDSQIRALTKGDICKEERILAMPAIRALTELDAQAREYEELRKKYPGSKS